MTGVETTALPSGSQAWQSPQNPTARFEEQQRAMHNSQRTSAKLYGPNMGNEPSWTLSVTGKQPGESYYGTESHNGANSARNSTANVETLANRVKDAIREGKELIGEGLSKKVYVLPPTTDETTAKVFYKTPTEESTQANFKTDTNTLETLKKLEIIPFSEEVMVDNEKYTVADKCNCELINKFEGEYTDVSDKAAPFKELVERASSLADKLIKKNVIGLDIHFHNVCVNSNNDPVAVDTDGFVTVDLEKGELREKECNVTETSVTETSVTVKTGDPYNWDLILQYFYLEPDAMKDFIQEKDPYAPKESIQNTLGAYHEHARRSQTVEDKRLRVFVSHYIMSKHSGLGGLVNVRALDVYNKASHDMKSKLDAFLNVLYGEEVYPTILSDNANEPYEHLYRRIFVPQDRPLPLACWAFVGGVAYLLQRMKSNKAAPSSDIDELTKGLKALTSNGHIRPSMSAHGTHPLSFSSPFLK